MYIYYISIYLYIHIYIYTHDMYIYIYIQDLYICIYIYMCVCVSLFISFSLSRFINICVCSLQVLKPMIWQVVQQREQWSPIININAFHHLISVSKDRVPCGSLTWQWKIPHLYLFFTKCKKKHMPRIFKCHGLITRTVTPLISRCYPILIHWTLELLSQYYPILAHNYTII